MAWSAETAAASGPNSSPEVGTGTGLNPAPSNLFGGPATFAPMGGFGYGPMGGFSMYGGGYGSSYGGYGSPYGYPGMQGVPGRPNNTVSEYVQLWLSAIQSVVNAVCTFSQLLDASFRSVTMSVGAMAEMSVCLQQLQTYLSADPSAAQFRVLGVPLHVRPNPNGVPWYVMLLLLYCVYRLVKKLLLRLLRWDRPALPTLPHPRSLGPPASAGGS
eukprot:EG_transcript_23356